MQEIVGESATSEVSIWILLLFLIVYAIVSEFLEHNNLPIHRSAIATIVGLILGLIMMSNDRNAFNSLVPMVRLQARDNETIIFMVLLPPIIFIDGFTINRRQFFRNLKYSVVFGIVGTFVFYMIIAGLIQLASNLGIYQLIQIC